MAPYNGKVARHLVRNQACMAAHFPLASLLELLGLRVGGGAMPQRVRKAGVFASHIALEGWGRSIVRVEFCEAGCAEGQRRPR